MLVCKSKIRKKHFEGHVSMMFCYCLLLLLSVGCVVKASSSQPISMQAWLNGSHPEVILFWPPPLNSDILIGPKLVSGKTDHIFLFYGDRNALSPESFTVYISESTDFPVDFGQDKADTTVRFEQITITDTIINVEILTRAKLPDRGIATFQIDNSNVVVQWSGVDEQTVLDLLAENIVHLSTGESALIANIENYITTLNK